MAKTSSFDPLDNLHSLSELEWKVLKAFCEGLDINQTAEVLHYKSQSVTDARARIYLKLWLNIHELAMRKKIIHQDICPAIREMESKPDPPDIEMDIVEDSYIPSETGDIQNEISYDHEELSDEIDEELEIPPEVYEMIDEDEKALIQINDELRLKEIDPSNNQNGSQDPGGCVRLLPWILVVLLSVALFIVLVRPPVLFSNEEVPSQPTQTQVSDEQEPPIQDKSQSPTNTPESLETTLTEGVVEGESEATQTSSLATDAPEIPLVNPAGTIFFDDFEERPDPAWEVLYGKLDMARKSYTVTATFMGYDKSPHYAVLRGQYWENMTITVNLLPFAEGHNACCFAEFGIIFRHKDNGDSLGVFIHPADGGIEFGTLHQNGQWDPHMGTLVTGKQLGFDLSKEGNQIIFEATDQSYVVYLNNLEITSASSTGVEYGEIGLWFIPDSTDKAVDSYAARIEDIRIESLP